MKIELLVAFMILPWILYGEKENWKNVDHGKKVISRYSSIPNFQYSILSVSKISQ